MTQLFTVVLSLSVSGALVGLLVLLFRPIFGRFFSKRWMYYLWMLVIARLLVPISADVNLMEYLSENLAAVGNVLTDADSVKGTAKTADGNERAETAQEDLQGELKSVSGSGKADSNVTLRGAADLSVNETGNVDDLHGAKPGEIAEQNSADEVADANMVENGATVGLSNVSGVEKRSDSSMSGGTKIDILASLLQYAAMIWIIGVLLTALRKLWIYRRFVKEVRMGDVAIAEQKQLGKSEGLRAGCAPVTDERILWQCAEIQRKLRIGKRVPLYESTVIDIPMLIGLRQPRIYLPQAFLAQMNGRENDVCLILHHELVHYKRKDIWYKWLFQAALCVHWFNPLVYVFSRKFNVDCELACDETVLKLLSEEGRKAYGNMLLDVAQKDWSEGILSGKGLGMHRNVLTMTLLEEKSTLKERLWGIACYHKTGLVVGLCSAAVLVMFLMVAVVCGTAGVRSDSVKAVSLYNGGLRSLGGIEKLSDRVEEISDPTFDLSKPVQINTKGKAYQIYDDDALIAGDSESDNWYANNYYGGENSVKIKKFTLNGSDTLWILHANKETTLEIFSMFHFYDGRFKLVWVGPDQTVQTLNESGEENTVKLTLPQGRNVIKMVGQKAKLKDVHIAYGGVKKEDFDGIYDNEASEYAYQVLEGKQPFDSARLKEAGPYLKEKEMSELCRKALEEEAVLSKENWRELFVYSDAKLSAQYLIEALQTGKAEGFDSEILVEIAPYMQEADVSECFRYLLEQDAVSEVDWQKIFVYSDGTQSAGYLAVALQKGMVSSFSDRALQEICPYVSTKRLTEVVTAMDELSFDSLEHVLAFVQQMDEAATCVYHYIDLGNALTDDQLREVYTYVSEGDFYRIVEYNGKNK